jgi:hypothetical protein
MEMNLSLGFKKTMIVFEEHFVGRTIELLFSKNIHTLFYPYSLYQLPSELHLSIQSNDVTGGNSNFFAIIGTHYENPSDGWRETFTFDINQIDIDRSLLYEANSVLLYRNKNNACFYIDRVEYYYLKTDSELSMFAVCLIQDESNRILIAHHGFGNGIELMVDIESIHEYFKENPFGKQLLKYIDL